MTYILCFINKGPITLSPFPQEMQHQLRETLVLCQNTAPHPPPRFMYANYFDVAV